MADRKRLLEEELAIVKEALIMEETETAIPPIWKFRGIWQSNVVTETLDKHQRFKWDGPNTTNYNINKFPPEKIKNLSIFVGIRKIDLRYSFLFYCQQIFVEIQFAVELVHFELSVVYCNNIFGREREEREEHNQ